MVEYKEKSDLVLANVLTYLENNKISSSRIVNIFYDGTNYICVYTVA